jgi:L-aminopeptidase/D-esterase-like protein
MPHGPHNALTDVAGLRVGHAQVEGGLSGTTVVLMPAEGAVAGADVRGAAPGTRETDLLRPDATVQRVHAIVLSGGSAYGLAAADGVMSRLEAAGVGFPVPGGVVPIVPAAVVFDLGRGGAFGVRPTAATGAAAYDAATAAPVAQGVIGAGTGAVVGGRKGGVGTASAVLESGATVAALVVLNAVGSAIDPASGLPHGLRAEVDGEFGPVAPVAPVPPDPPTPGTATTLAVVATDLTLDKAGAARLATMGHDGLARAINPVHTVMDGDTIFGLSTCARPAPMAEELFALHAAAAEVVTRAVVHALLKAEAVTTTAGSWPGPR